MMRLSKCHYILNYLYIESMMSYILCCRTKKIATQIKVYEKASEKMEVDFNLREIIRYNKVINDYINYIKDAIPNLKDEK